MSLRRACHGGKAVGLPTAFEETGEFTKLNIKNIPVA